MAETLTWLCHSDVQSEKVELSGLPQITAFLHGDSKLSVSGGCVMVQRLPAESARLVRFSGSGSSQLEIKLRYLYL